MVGQVVEKLGVMGRVVVVAWQGVGLPVVMVVTRAEEVRGLH